MSETNTPDYSKERQFLRNIRVIVKNFKKEEKIILGNEFEIEFEWFKTIDQTQEDDSGKVTIYGLSDTTIAMLEEEGGEVWLDCGYEQSYVGTLFIAYASRVYTEVKGNITATTLECSANMLTHFFSGWAVSDEVTEVPLLTLLQNLGTNLGFPATIMSLEDVPEDVVENVAEFVTTYKTTSYNIGSLMAILDEVTDYYGLSFSRQLVDDVDTAVFSFTKVGLLKTLNKILAGYPKLDVNSPETRASEATFFKQFKSEDIVRQGFVLTRETGLIESQAEYQVVTSFLHQKLNANEIETAESFYKRNNTLNDDTSDDLDTEEPTTATPNISKGAIGDNNLVSNSALRGLKIKPNLVPNTNSVEATAGGQVRQATVALAFSVQSLLGSDLIYFSAFNDKYHVDNSPTSLHTQGKSFDVTIRSGKSGAPAQAKAIRELAKQQGYRVNVDDEYNYPSSKATSGHIHVDVYGRGEQTGNEPQSAVNDSSEKPKKKKGDFYGRTPIEIYRRYNRITALLNPAVKPQSLIFTEDKNSEDGDYLVHRVRHASYRGNNKRGEWTMTLYCEDTETGRVAGAKVESTPQTVDTATPSVGE